MSEEESKEVVQSDLKLESVTEGQNERGIPIVKFLEDIETFANSFSPPASPELLIGAYSDLFSKFKKYESSLMEKRRNFQEKIPVIEQSLTLVKQLKKKQEDEQKLVARYSLADAVFGKAEIDTSSGIVNLWLGANVMLEYTYDEAIELLSTKGTAAKKDFEEATNDLAFTRNQIITAEVNISRIYNWDVRRKREMREAAEVNKFLLEKLGTKKIRLAMTSEEAVPDSLLLSFFREGAKDLDACDLKEGDREAPQELTIYRKRVLEVQRGTLARVVADYDGVELEAAQGALKDQPRMERTDQSVKMAMMVMNGAARKAFARLVLHQECIWENNDNGRSLIRTGKIEKKALMEFCGLCNAMVMLEIVLKHLRDGSPMFKDTEEPERSEEIFPQKRLERLQRMMMRAVGYDPAFGTTELQRIFMTSASDGNEFDGDMQVHQMFANLGTMMNSAITNATMEITNPKLSDQDEGGHTRVVSVNYAEKIVEPGEWNPNQSIGAPMANSMQDATEEQKKQLMMAREAAAMQQAVLAELLQMGEDDRERKLKVAKQEHDKFLKKVMELPPGHERVEFMRSVDPETNRLLLMHKLWDHMLQANGGKPPHVHYRK